MNRPPLAIALAELPALAAQRAPGTIDVVFCDCDALDLDAACLDDAERARAARFATETLRRRFRRSHAFQRAVLAAYLAQAPAQLAFALGEQGKPRLRDARLAFNLSHSEQWAVVAVGDTELGVDCERARAELDWAGLLRGVAHVDEDVGDRAAFYRLWTRKEAALKQLGLGLTLAPERLRVPAPAAPLARWERTHWDGGVAPWVIDLAAPEGWFAALAAPTAQAWRVFRLAAPDEVQPDSGAWAASAAGGAG